MPKQQYITSVPSFHSKRRSTHSVLVSHEPPQPPNYMEGSAMTGKDIDPTLFFPMQAKRRSDELVELSVYVFVDLFGPNHMSDPRGREAPGYRRLGFHHRASETRTQVRQKESRTFVMWPFVGRCLRYVYHQPCGQSGNPIRSGRGRHVSPQQPFHTPSGEECDG